MEQALLELETIDSPSSMPVSNKPDLDLKTLPMYDRIVLFFSGGKDSVACFLRLVELGVPLHKIELHHHLVDGDSSSLMDWPITSAYCRAFADHFGVSYKESWRVGGFEGEMTRTNAPTGAVSIPLVGGGHKVVGGDGPLGTRNKFPQVAASLSVRWCSSALKIDVGSRYLTNDERFLEGKTLVITGERAQESKARANYELFEPHRSDNRNGARVKRHIDHWRAVHSWSEQQVWEIIQRHSIVAHPAYYLGWSRCSCRVCIFGNKNQWATVRQIAPHQFYTVAQYEEQFGVTIHRKHTVIELAEQGTSHAKSDSPWIAIANGTTWDLPMTTGVWVLPEGAYGESGGPT